MPVIGAVLADQIISAKAEFVLSDWIASAGNYQLDIAHNLDSENINVMLWENGSEMVMVDRKSIINQNTVRLYVSLDPDCRFEGRAIIFRIQEE